MKCSLMILYLFLAGCTTVISAQEPGSKPKAQTVPEDFVIGLEDVLRIDVWEDPKLSVAEVMVRPDGKISVPLINDITASGLTPIQLKEQLEEKFNEFLKASPTVTVVVLKIGSQYVSIVGQVNSPGVFYLGSPMTVLELLARAGGFLEYADVKNISIMRKTNNSTKNYSFNYKDVAKGKNPQQNITLKNGDIVIVP